MDKLMKAAGATLSALFGAALFTLPSLLGLFYHDIPHAWALLLLLALVGASTYYHAWARAMRRVEARIAVKVDLDRIAHLYGVTRNAGEGDAELRARIMGVVKGTEGRE